jgi:hypothetical protein
VELRVDNVAMDFVDRQYDQLRPDVKTSFPLLKILRILV